MNQSITFKKHCLHKWFRPDNPCTSRQNGAQEQAQVNGDDAGPGLLSNVVATVVLLVKAARNARNQVKSKAEKAEKQQSLWKLHD